MKDLPMPGDEFGGGTVIASVWTKDDPPRFATVVILNPQPPYYTVAEAIGPDEDYDRWLLREETCEDFENINFAVHAYAQMGGDV